MSKKSRRRNKKILGALGALGAIAMLGKRKASPSTNADAVKAMTSDAAYSPKKKPVVIIPKKKPVKRDSILASPVINKMDTSEVDIPDNYFKKPSKIITRSKPDINKMDISEVDISENVYKKPLRKPITFGSGDDGLSYFKKGGRVKGCGIAKKGFGRAMKKGRK